MTRGQKRILILCMAAYTVLYMMRLNISLALPSLGEDLGFAFETLGGITSAFFWSYAIGQLINGWLGDRVPIRWMVFLGLLLSAVFNILIGLTHSYILILLFWGVNGFVQSMLWSPIVKCMSENFSGEQLVVANFSLSITQVAGYMLAWTISYGLNLNVGWRAVFLVPGCVGVVMALLWILLFRAKTSVNAVSANHESLFRKPKLILFLAAIAGFSILLGLVKSSLDTWLPTMISDVGFASSKGVVVTLLVIPLINFAGIMLARVIVKKKGGNVYGSILILWGISIVIAVTAAILFRVSPVASVILTGLLFGSVYAQTPLFTSFIPLDMAGYGHVSTITGFVDFAIYVGAAITGVASTNILGGARNWNRLMIYWVIVLVVGGVVAFGVRRYRKWLSSHIHGH